MSKLETVTDLRCSFCNKPHGEVRKLIAGPEDVAICDECLEVCNDIVADTPGPAHHVRPALDIDEPIDESDLFRFKCPECGHQWKMAKPR